MLRIAGAVGSGLLICLFYFLGLYLLDAKGKYSFPRKRGIPFSVPILITAVFTLVTWIVYSMSNTGITFIWYFADMCMIWGLAVLTVTDWMKHTIPNKMLMILLIIWVSVACLMILYMIEAGMAFTFTGLAGALVGGIIFLLCYLLSKRQLGAGDVKLVFVLGLFLTGERIIGAIFYGVIFCGIFSLIQLLRKKITVKDGVPLVPFLYLGTVFTLLIL